MRMRSIWAMVLTSYLRHCCVFRGSQELVYDFIWSSCNSIRIRYDKTSKYWSILSTGEILDHPNRTLTFIETRTSKFQSNQNCVHSFIGIKSFQFLRNIFSIYTNYIVWYIWCGCLMNSFVLKNNITIFFDSTYSF